MDCPACHHPNVDGARFCAKCGAPLPASAAQDADPLIGQIVGGRFRIIDILGEGGMGRVYSAEQQMGTSVRKVAVKTLLAQFAKDPQVHARFMRECGTVSELEHPNTIRVYDFGQTDSGELYIAMELLQGESLEAVLERGGPISPERADRILGQVCGSLQEAHEKGIVHRDLKPANIQLSTRAGEDDYVKVLDFGIAKRSETKDSKAEQKLTQQGTILGTPPYMSPEQFTGKELDARSDIYSLGVMAYEMLAGRLPFDADTPWQWATQHMTAKPFPFETLPMAAAAPEKMKAAIMRALHKDREERQQSAREFFDDITIGAQRLSMVAGMGTASFPGSGPVASSGARPGKTQVGEPLFVGGAPAGAPAGRTVVGSMPPETAPSPTMPQTGGGQAFSAPQPEAKKSNAGIVIAAVAVLGVIGVVVGVVATKSGGGEDSVEAIALPSGAPVALVSSTPPEASADPSANADGDAGAAPTTTGATTSAAATTGGGTTGGAATSTVNQADAKAAAECEAAINLARGTNTMLAISHYRQCKGPRQGEARSAIDSSAAREVKAKGCRAKSTADAAAAIGASSGRAALPASCKK